jgi:type III pantothenate kinase
MGLAKTYFNVDAFYVEPGVKTGVKVLIDNPAELGADRLVNAVAGIEMFGAPLIVVDFGTATTFDVINAKKEYLGGLICPGLKISADALFERASRLPRVEIAEPERLVGRNTVQAMQSGIFYGYIGMVDGILERLLADSPESKVAATGGLSRVIATHSKYIKHIALDLTLDGLRTLWFRNQGAGRK